MINQQYKDGSISIFMDLRDDIIRNIQKLQIKFKKNVELTLPNSQKIIK